MRRRLRSGDEAWASVGGRRLLFRAGVGCIHGTGRSRGRLVPMGWQPLPRSRGIVSLGADPRRRRTGGVRVVAGLR